MGKKRKDPSRKTTCSEGKIAKDVEAETRKYEEELQKAKEENENLRRKVQKLQSDSNRVIYLAKQGRLTNIDVTLQANVISTARKIIYPKCPYISSHEHLVKCTRIVGKKMSIAIDEMDEFIALYKSTVNNAITTRRNANVQQVRRKLQGRYVRVIRVQFTIKRTNSEN